MEGQLEKSKKFLMYIKTIETLLDDMKKQCLTFQSENALEAQVPAEFSMTMANFIQKEPFFIRMKMDTSRAGGLIREAPQLFEGSYWRDPEDRKRTRYWVNPDKFLRAALKYRYKNRVEQEIAAEFLDKMGHEE